MIVHKIHIKYKGNFARTFCGYLVRPAARSKGDKPRRWETKKGGQVYCVTRDSQHAPTCFHCQSVRDR
jgi:hypothetical protein